MLYPAALLCYLPLSGFLRLRVKALCPLVLSVVTAFVLLGSAVCMRFQLKTNALLLPMMAPFMLLYVKSVKLPLPKALFVFFTASMLTAFSTSLTNYLCAPIELHNSEPGVRALLRADLSGGVAYRAGGFLAALPPENPLDALQRQLHLHLAGAVRRAAVSDGRFHLDYAVVPLRRADRPRAGNQRRAAHHLSERSVLALLLRLPDHPQDDGGRRIAGRRTSCSAWRTRATANCAYTWTRPASSATISASTCTSSRG